MRRVSHTLLVVLAAFEKAAGAVVAGAMFRLALQIVKGTEFEGHCFKGLIMCCIELGPCHVDDDILEDALDLAHLSLEETLLFETRCFLPDDLYHV